MSVHNEIEDYNSFNVQFRTIYCMFSETLDLIYKVIRFG